MERVIPLLDCEYLKLVRNNNSSPTKVSMFKHCKTNQLSRWEDWMSMDKNWYGFELIFIGLLELTDWSQLKINQYYYVRNHYDEWYVGKFNGKSYDFTNDDGNFSPLGVNNCYRVVVTSNEWLGKELHIMNDDVIEDYIKEHNDLYYEANH